MRQIKEENIKPLPEVFCNNCKYNQYDSVYSCKKIIGIKKTPKKLELKHASPEEDNKNNTCKYFEKKRWYD